MVILGDADLTSAFPCTLITSRLLNFKRIAVIYRYVTDQVLLDPVVLLQLELIVHDLDPDRSLLSFFFFYCWHSIAKMTYLL